MNKEEKIAENISKILSPVVIAFIATLWFSIFSPLQSHDLLTITTSIILGIFFLSIFPAFAVVYNFKKGKIDLWVSDRKTRTPFYFVALTGYIIASIVFFMLDYKAMFVLSIAYIFVTAVIMLVNLFWKVSTHSGGVTGPVTALIHGFGIYAIPLTALIPIVIWARLKLKAHSLMQLIMGVVIAAFFTSIIYLLLY
jgi:hypothetical protein